MHLRSNALIRAVLAISFALFIAGAIAIIKPVSAFADYENPSVTTIAQMQTDNSLHVNTQRAYQFNDQYSIIAIPLSKTSSESSLSIDSVRMIQLGGDESVIRDWWSLERVRFQPAWRGLLERTQGLSEDVRREEADIRQKANENPVAERFFTLPGVDSYSFDSRNSVVYVFLTPTSLNTVIECDYEVAHAALMYEDVAELYWDYISPMQDADSQNVDVQIQLPVPDDAEFVAGQTVKAWGHGPQGSLVENSDGTVNFKVANVKSGQYAQAHIIFPSSWLTNIKVQEKLKKNGFRADAALEEELGWSDAYSASLVNAYTVDIVQISICVLLVVTALVVYLRKTRRGAGRLKADVGIEDIAQTFDRLEPAILSRLLRDNHWSYSDFGRTVASLEEKGIITIDVEENIDATRFKVTPSAKKLDMTDLDRATMEIVFDIAGDGYQSVAIGEIRSFCENNHAVAKKKIEDWQHLLDREVASSGLFDPKSKRASRGMATIGGIVGVVGILEWVATSNWLCGIAMVLTGVVLLGIAYLIPRRSAFGANVADYAVKLDVYEGDSSDSQNSDWVEVLASIFESVVTSPDD